MNNLSSLPITVFLYPLIIIYNLHLFLFSDQISAATSTTDDDNQFYRNCGNTFNCGSSITGIRYPFRGSNDPSYCGYPGLVLDCDGSTNSTTINIVNQKYVVLQISQSAQTMKIVRGDVMKDICPSDQLANATLDFSLFEYTGNYINLTFLYGCAFPINLPAASQILVSCVDVYAIYGPLSFGICRTSVVYPVLESSFLSGGSVNATVTGQILQEGFEIRWKVDSSACIECVSSKGRCGYDFGTSQTTCFCPDLTYLTTKGTCSLVDVGNGIAGISPGSAPSVSKGGPKGTSNSIVLPVVGAVLAGIGFGWLVFYCRQRRKRLVVGSSQLSITDKKELPTTPLTNKDETVISPSIAFTKSVPSYPSTQSEFRRDTSYFGAKVFSYTELEEATENFAASRQIGDGGFGAVYYGKLADGCIVAVKRLYENNFKRVEQFMNEVEILTRLRHSNLVTLYGCTSKISRELLLVYEYVPNGTVADHLHGKRANSRLLSWPVRLNIAIETANALVYLHASDIIHRDVKTNNILLDNDFHVKVADFGLVRLFPNNATHVSTAPQGTPGYVDPDYYQSYQLTEKSDVYSFGVVLIELISSLQAVDTNRHRHEINLSNMAINKIQNHTLHELVDPNLQFEANTCVKRMITVVAELAFRCLQQEKDMRPSMQEVLDTLLGIKNGVLNSEKVQVLSIIVDNGDLVKDNNSPFSPNSVTNKWASGGSTKNSSG